MSEIGTSKLLPFKLTCSGPGNLCPSAWLRLASPWAAAFTGEVSGIAPTSLRLAIEGRRCLRVYDAVAGSLTLPPALSNSVPLAQNRSLEETPDRETYTGKPREPENYSPYLCSVRTPEASEERPLSKIRSCSSKESLSPTPLLWDFGAVKMNS